METAVLLSVPEAEPVVGSWRDQGDPAAALGIPAHVTLLYPFLPLEQVDAGVLGELEWFFHGVDAFDVAFDHVRELADSGVLYLDPVGRELDELAAALARRWPETPPFSGAVARPHAHLTVLHTADSELRARACDEVQAQLPLTVRATTAALWACDDDGRWTQRQAFAFRED